MPTHGVISVREDGGVVLKIVVGDGGHNAPRVAARIRALNRVPTPDEAIGICAEERFGCSDCRTIVTPTEVVIESGEQAGPLYRSTFLDPNFNPRWEWGTAAHTEIVDL